MAKLDLNPDTASAFVDRLQAVEGDVQRQWGTLSAAAMMRHLNYSLELSLEEVAPPKVFMPMPGIVAWYLFFVWFTDWPKGKITAPPEFLPEGEEELDPARQQCIAAVERFVERLGVSPERKAYTPLLGNIPLRKWARLHGVHMDHHLRQFNV